MVKFRTYDNNGSVLVAYSYRGKRDRKTFKTKKAAAKFIAEKTEEIQKLEARAVLNLSLDARKSVAGELPSVRIVDAIKKQLENLELRYHDSDNFKKERANYKAIYEGLFKRNIDFLHEITLIELEALQNDWMEAGQSWSTINRRMATLKSFLNKCVDWGFLAENKASKLKPLQGEYAQKEHWTQEEIERILEEIGEEARNLFVALEQLAGRPKELCNLTWDLVDFERGGLFLSSRKGKGSLVRKRWIPLTEKQIDFFKSIGKQQKLRFQHRPDGYVFLNSVGKKATTDWLGQVIRRARRKLKMRDGLVPYALRGMLLSFLADMDIAPSKLRALAGHAKDETTNKYYIRHGQEQLRNVVSLAEEAKKKEREKRLS